MIKTYVIPSIDRYGFRHAVFLGNAPGMTKTADVADYVGSLTGADLPPSVALRVKEILAQSPSDVIYSLISAVQAWETWGANRNGDTFLRDDLMRDYKTYVTHGRVYWRHNKFGNGPFGRVVDAFYDVDMDRVLVLAEIDLKKASQVAKEALNHILNDYPVLTSMGVRPEYDICTKCGHISKTWSQHCDHVKNYLNRDLPGDWWLAPPVAMVNKNNVFRDISIVFVNAWRGSFSIANAVDPKDVLVYPWMSVYDSLKPEPRRKGVLVDGLKTADGNTDSPYSRESLIEFFEHRSQTKSHPDVNYEITGSGAAIFRDALKGYKTNSGLIDDLCRAVLPSLALLRPMPDVHRPVETLASLLHAGTATPRDLLYLIHRTLRPETGYELYVAYRSGQPLPGIGIHEALEVMEILIPVLHRLEPKVAELAIPAVRTPQAVISADAAANVMTPAQVQDLVRKYQRALIVEQAAKAHQQQIQQATAAALAMLGLPVAVNLAKKLKGSRGLSPQEMAILAIIGALFGGGLGYIGSGKLVQAIMGSPREIAERYIHASDKAAEGLLKDAGWKTNLAAAGVSGGLTLMASNMAALNDLNSGRRVNRISEAIFKNPGIGFASGGVLGLILLNLLKGGRKIKKVAGVREPDKGLMGPRGVLGIWEILKPKGGT